MLLSPKRLCQELMIDFTAQPERFSSLPPMTMSA
jgi:hypothetical protein